MKAQVELYAFQAGDQSEPRRYTSCEMDVHDGGHHYRSLPIRRSPLGYGPEAGKSVMRLDVPFQSDLLPYLLDATTRGVIVSATLLKLEAPDAVAPVWVGRVQAVEVHEEAARIHCESILASLRRVGLRKLYSRRCTHELYGFWCSATPIAATAVVAAVDGNRVAFAGGIPAVVNGKLSGGWLQTQQGARHMIVEETPDAVRLFYPARLAVGAGVTLTAGCDRSMETCRTRFNNLANYGGFPFIPRKNPFNTGVF